MQELEPVGEGVPRALVTPQHQLFGAEAAESPIDEVVGEAARAVDRGGHGLQCDLVEERRAEESEEHAAQVPPELLHGRRQVGEIY